MRTRSCVNARRSLNSFFTLNPDKGSSPQVSQKERRLNALNWICRSEGPGTNGKNAVPNEITLEAPVAVSGIQDHPNPARGSVQSE